MYVAQPKLTKTNMLLSCTDVTVRCLQPVQVKICAECFTLIVANKNRRSRFTRALVVAPNINKCPEIIMVTKLVSRGYSRLLSFTSSTFCAEVHVLNSRLYELKIDYLIEDG